MLRLSKILSIIAAPMVEEDDNSSESGIWVEDNNWEGGNSVEVWSIPSLFAFNDDHGEEIAHVDYSPDETTNGRTLHFDQMVDGHKIVFDLMSTLP